jgi:alpha/beta superfamily hydrolase
LKNTSAIIEERVRFGGDNRLAGVLSYPDGDAPKLAVLLCSPHPNFAGDMENNVIVALAEEFSAAALTLRFDYRGIGQSQIELPTGVGLFDYWDTIEQTLDYRDPLIDVAEAADSLWDIGGELPMVAVGYSFGAVTGTRTAVGDSRFVGMVGVAAPFTRIEFEHLANCSKPCLMISGSDDFVYSPQVVDCLEMNAGDKLIMDRLPHVDHFFRRQERMLADRVAKFVDGLRSR